MAALANRDASPEALRDGVELTLRQLSQALEKSRVAPISPKRLRAVTHLDVDAAGIDHALAAIRAAL